MTDANKSPNLKVKVLQVLRLAIASVVRFLCRLYYGNEGEKIPPIADDVLKLPAMEVARKIRNQEITSTEVLEACVRRIKDVNSAINCFVEDRFELAFKEAKEADDLIRSGTKTVEQIEKEQPLLGVPFTTKDCLAVKGLHQTSGVVLRKDIIADEDADAIRLVREKGAIIIGLTNVPELCMWWESHNHIHGRNKNPYNTTRITGGSSGGEGSCQAVGGSIFGIGSDIGGSIRMPCFFNGVFGHKATKYIVSFKGSAPSPETELQESFLGVGPITRHASDLKPLLKILAADNASKLKLDEPVDFKKIKFYYQFQNEVPYTDPVDSDIINAMKKVVEFLKVQHNIDAEERKLPLQRSLAIWMATMKGKIPFGQRIMENYTKGNVVKEIIKNMFGLSGNTLIALLTALYTSDVTEEMFQHFKKKRDDLEKVFKDLLGNDGVLLFPTHPTPALYHHEPIARPFNFSYTAVVNCMGLPATTIPLGLGREGLPIGIQVIANHGQDRLCLAVAEELDRAFGGWVEPQKS